MVSVCVCLSGCSLCLLDTTVSPTKAAEQIEMPFGMWTPWPNEPCLMWEPGSLTGRGTFEGHSHWHVAVNILNVIRKRAAAMRLQATSNVATCYHHHHHHHEQQQQWSCWDVLFGCMSVGRSRSRPALRCRRLDTRLDRTLHRRRLPSLPVSALLRSVFHTNCWWKDLSVGYLSYWFILTLFR